MKLIVECEVSMDGHEADKKSWSGFGKVGDERGLEG